MILQNCFCWISPF